MERIRRGNGETLELDLLGQMTHRLDNHPQQEEEGHHRPPPVWDIVKTLTRSDVDQQQCRLLLHHDHVTTFFPKWDPVKEETIADGRLLVQVLVKDVDTGFSTHWVVFRRWKSNGSYVFKSGWSRYFVVRRDLKEGDEIGLCWDSKQSCFLFSVLNRA
ncbi:hypothetical protein MRB53_027425 [Persea americana]|uniref:Uncharacterized protein n=1 Tax=Persea americana TaxID=3435 RepID=A0ACC2LKY5_PERAE|nr:hypothetical protein MRB53_027425 [Persea americana]